MKWDFPRFTRTTNDVQWGCKLIDKLNGQLLQSSCNENLVYFHLKGSKLH